MLNSVVLAVIIFVAGCSGTIDPAYVAVEEGGLCGHWQTAPHNMVFAHNAEKLYVTDEEAARVLVISTQSLRVERIIDMPSPTYGIAASADGNLVYAVAIQARAIIVVNTRNDAVVDTIPLTSQQPLDIALSKNDSLAYVSSAYGPSIDPPTMTVVDLHRHTLRNVTEQYFFLRNNELMPLDLPQGAQRYAPFLINGLFVSNDGTVFAGLYEDANILKDSGKVAFTRLKDGVVMGTVHVGGLPEWALFSRDNTKLYIKTYPPFEYKPTRYKPPSIVVVDAINYKIEDRIALNDNIGQGAFSPDGRFLYLVAYKRIPDDQRLLIKTVVSVIDAETNRIVGEIPIPVPSKGLVRKSCQ